MSATFSTGASAPVEGRAAQRPGSMQALLPVDASPPFWYIHHPAKWQLVGDRWLPMLSTMRADPGVNRVDKDSNTDQAELAYRRKGWTVIPWEAEPGGYCIAYDGHKGAVHLSRWERPEVFAGQCFIRSDSDGYWAFCARLLEDGTIARPDPRFIDLVIADQTRLVENLRTQAMTVPGVATTLTVAEERLAKMIAAKESLYADAPKKGKR